VVENDVLTAIDLSVTSGLGLQDISALREMLGREPVVTDKSLATWVVPGQEIQTPRMLLLFT